MGFGYVCVGDLDELWLCVYLLDVGVVGVVYGGVQVVYQLVDDGGQGIFVWYVIFDVFWYQFFGVGGGVLEVVVG